MRWCVVVGLTLLGATAPSQMPTEFPAHLGATHKFPTDPKFIWKYPPALAEALDHLSNRLWAVGVCADDQFHPEMQLVEGEFAVWVSGLVTAYKSMPYTSVPFEDYPRVSKLISQRLIASKKHVEEQLLRHDAKGFYKESPLAASENSDYQFAYRSLFNDQAWMGVKGPFEPMTRHDLAEWFVNGFSDTRYREELRKQPVKHRFAVVSRGEALLRLFRVSRAIIPIVNVSSTWVDPILPPAPALTRFVMRDKLPSGETVTIAVAASEPTAPLKFVVDIQQAGKRKQFKAASVSEFRSLITSIRRTHPDFKVEGDYYSSDAGVRIRSPFPPIFYGARSSVESSLLVGAHSVGWGRVPKMQESAYKSFVASRAAAPIDQIQQDHANFNYAFVWKNERANYWQVTSGRYWTFFSFANGPGPFNTVPTPLIEAWIYYSRP